MRTLKSLQKVGIQPTYSLDVVEQLPHLVLLQYVLIAYGCQYVRDDQLQVVHVTYLGLIQLLDDVPPILSPLQLLTVVLTSDCHAKVALQLDHVLGHETLIVGGLIVQHNLLLAFHLQLTTDVLDHVVQLL